MKQNQSEAQVSRNCNLVGAWCASVFGKRSVSEVTSGVAREAGERTRPRVLFAAPRRKHGRAQERTTMPPSNLHPFGVALNGAREARALPRALARNVFWVSPATFSVLVTQQSRSMVRFVRWAAA